MSPTVRPPQRPHQSLRSAFTHVVITLSLSFFFLASPSYALPSEPAGLPLAVEATEWQVLPKTAADEAVAIDGPYESSTIEGSMTEDSAPLDWTVGKATDSPLGDNKQAGDV